MKWPIRAIRDAPGVSSRTDRDEEGRRIAADIRAELGAALWVARLGAGLSQRVAAGSVGMSHSQWSRIEGHKLSDLSLDQASRAAAALGLRMTVRMYPHADAVRDAAQLALLERFRSRLPPGARWATEVPLPIPGDRRAWDAMVVLGGRRAGCEAETRIRDIQALERRLALKLRDGAVDVMIVVVADTAANRGVLRAHREVLRGLLPLDGRDVLASIRAGTLPPESGLLML